MEMTPVICNFTARNFQRLGQSVVHRGIRHRALLTPCSVLARLVYYISAAVGYSQPCLPTVNHTRTVVCIECHVNDVMSYS